MNSAGHLIIFFLFVFFACFLVGDRQWARTNQWFPVRGGASQAACAQAGLRQTQRPVWEEGWPPHHPTTRRQRRGRLNRPQHTPGHHLHPRFTVRHSFDGVEGETRLFKRIRRQLQIPTEFTRDQLCTPRITEQWHISEFPFVACQMEAYLCLLVESHKWISDKRP